MRMQPFARHPRLTGVNNPNPRTVDTEEEDDMSTAPRSTTPPFTRRRPARKTGLAALAVLSISGLALTACGGDDAAGFADGSASATATASEPNGSGDSSPAGGAGAGDDTGQDSGGDQDVIIAEVDEPIDFPVCEEAETSGTATVTWLEDTVIEEERHPGSAAETVTVDGEEVEIPAVPDIVVPERVAQAGCVIEYRAPGGCLPAVEISESFIPGYRVPERTTAGIDLPDGTELEERVQEPLEQKAVRAEGVRAEEVCQVEPAESSGDQVVSFVVRPSIVRPSIVQGSTVAPSQVRPATSTAAGDAVPVATMTAYSVPTLSVPAASVPADSLDSYVVEGTEGTEYAERDDVVSYTTEGDVLFDSDAHAVRSDAVGELEAIAEDIADRGGDPVIRVEGHTDDLPTQAYADNEELSLRRAESVADWLVEHAGVDRDAITAEGLGEDHPRADNGTDAGRQQNRRVVITVTPRDHEPEIEVED